MGTRTDHWLLCVIVAAAAAGCGGADTVPPDVTVERFVAKLAPPLPIGASADGPCAPGVRRGILTPGHRAAGGTRRDALLTPPQTTLRFRLDVQPDLVLRFSAGVEMPQRRDPEPRSGLAFEVAVDGQRRFDWVLNPHARRRDRRWIDGEVDLGPWAGRTVELTFETRAEDADRPPAGTPGWSRVRVVHRERVRRQTAEEGPNVLFLLVDTLRADRLGLYGAAPSPSPALDRFAGHGTVFEVAVAQASWTMPAVASIFTGLHPRSHGAVGLDPHGHADHSGAGTVLPDSLVTLAEVAQAAGFSTFGVSTNMLIARGTQLAQGFETFELLPFDGKKRSYASARAVNRRFREWLRTARGHRFFAYLHYMEPHGPYTPPAERVPRPPAGLSNDLAAGWVRDVAVAVNQGRMPPPGAETVAYLRALYDAEIQVWDEAFADLLRALEAERLLERTIVIVAADHGEEFLEHGKLTHGEQLYEETVRIPLVFAGPGIPAARRPDLAQQIDLLPTVAPLLGASAPPGLPGRDLFAGTESGDAVSEIVAGFGERGAGRGSVALRAGDRKLITRSGGPVELYDLRHDPAERANLAPAAPETEALVAQLDRWSAAARPPPRSVEADPALRDRLRQLGYVD